MNTAPKTRVELPDGRVYSIHPGFHGWRVVRVNCGSGKGAMRLVTYDTPLWHRVMELATSEGDQQ